MNKSDFVDFTQRLKLLIGKNPQLITTTLSNIFTMRLVGNKTHGDLAEIAICEFINQFMDGYSAEHVGKLMYRGKQSEEDIKIIDDTTKAEFTVSIKAYGNKALQLSTDKNHLMFPLLETYDDDIKNTKDIQAILDSPAFKNFALFR